MHPSILLSSNPPSLHSSILPTFFFVLSLSDSKRKWVRPHGEKGYPPILRSAALPEAPRFDEAARFPSHNAVHQLHQTSPPKIVPLDSMHSTENTLLQRMPKQHWENRDIPSENACSTLQRCWQRLTTQHLKLARPNDTGSREFLWLSHIIPILIDDFS